MTHPLATAEAQIILRGKSLDDFIASTVFANDMTPNMPAERKAVHGIVSTILWLQAHGVELTPELAAQFAEWQS